MRSISYNDRRGNVNVTSRLKNSPVFVLDNSGTKSYMALKQFQPIEPTLKASELSLQKIVDGNMEAFLRPVGDLPMDNIFDRIESVENKMDNLSSMYNNLISQQNGNNSTEGISADGSQGSQAAV